MGLSAFLGGRAPNEALLTEYLRSRTEWIRLEFKEARRPPEFGIRKTVAAFANTEGGDLLLGVDDDGKVMGTTFDPAEVSRILQQKEAPPRVEWVTNLVQVVGDPRSIELADKSIIYWIDVPSFGALVAAVKPDGSLGLYTRPGAESPEVTGFAAVELFRSRTRARLMRSLYDNLLEFYRAIPFVVPSRGFMKDYQLNRIRQVVDSPEWAQVATAEDRGLVDGPLKFFLGYVEDQAEWERDLRQYGVYLSIRRNDLRSSVQNLRVELVRARILPESTPPVA